MSEAIKPLGGTAYRGKEPIEGVFVDAQGKQLVVGQREQTKRSGASILLGKVAERVPSTEYFDYSVWLDVEFPHVVFVAGKSYNSARANDRGTDATGNLERGGGAGSREIGGVDWSGRLIGCRAGRSEPVFTVAPGMAIGSVQRIVAALSAVPPWIGVTRLGTLSEPPMHPSGSSHTLRHAIVILWGVRVCARKGAILGRPLVNRLRRPASWANDQGLEVGRERGRVEKSGIFPLEPVTG